ncbi:MAG TPA: M18 family aminopeptidase [Cellvibrionaceae bacterium]
MNTLVNGLLAFLQASPSPYHAVEQIKTALIAGNFIQLDEKSAWDLKPGGRYFIVRREASILAFVYGQQPLTEAGIRIIGAHTDSPCLKVKPRPEKISQGYQQIGVEIYGGVLLNPWFDRDLSIAGRVAAKTLNGDIIHPLVDFKQPVAVIPSLAIHLDRTANEQRTVNPQEDMRPILLQGSALDFRAALVELCHAQGHSNVAEIYEYDLCLYDTQSAALVGLKQEFIASARLDNLLSCYLGLQALLAAPGEQSALLLLTDHEEVGSQSDVGARSNLLNGFLQRLFGCDESRLRALANSMMLSVDNAHGIHPNYPRKHDDNHGPLLNAGPVLKVDANQGYATSSETASFVRLLAQQAGVSVQSFVTRADMRCGSTIGPMTAALSGVRTADIGLPTFAMHSIRELAGVQDPELMLRLLKGFVSTRELT